MVDFLLSIGDFLISILSLAANLIAGLWQLLLMIPQALTYISTIIGVMPGVVSVFATAMIAVSVVYLVIDR